MQGVTLTEGPVIVMCVQRVNAVWHVKHTLSSFTESQRVKGQIYCESCDTIFCVDHTLCSLFSITIIRVISSILHLAPNCGAKQALVGGLGEEAGGF